MRIYFNNAELNIEASTSLETLLAQMDLPATGTALAVNNIVIPKAKWSETLLKAEDKIVVIKAVCGG